MGEGEREGKGRGNEKGEEKGKGHTATSFPLTLRYTCRPIVLKVEDYR